MRRLRDLLGNLQGASTWTRRNSTPPSIDLQIHPLAPALNNAAIPPRHLNLNHSSDSAPPISGGGCLFNTIGTALSEAALSEFHNKRQNPSSPCGSAQNDLPTLPSALSPVKSRILPQNTNPAVVYVVLESATKPDWSKWPVCVLM
jgi:hypothetical protein